MFSIIVDVAIGMIFTYLLLSLICSAANEVIELLLKKRAIDLERGIREMLTPGAPSGTPDIVQKLYDHALINNLFGKTYMESRIASRLRYVRRTQLPSYIPARNFALALMDLVVDPAGGASGTTGSTPAVTNVKVNLTAPAPAPLPPGNAANPLTPLREGIAASSLPDNVQRGLIALVDAAGNDVAKARENIESWFNTSMDRVSSWYKRRTQVVILIVGLFLAVTVNADSIAIARKLSTDESLRESLVASAVEYAKAHATPTPAENSGQERQAAADTTARGSARTGATATASPSPNTPPAATNSPTPGATNSPTPCPSPAPTPVQTNLPEACKDLNSADCKKELPNLIEECKTNVDSDACRTKAELLSSCIDDPRSPECKRARILVTIPECIADQDSPTCKDKVLFASIPACNECKPGKDPKESPQCKLEVNRRQLEALNLPIGWGSLDDVQRKWPGWDFRGPSGWFSQLRWHWMGWLLTALAISLGAPFWFDLLNKFIVIRSAVKPHEKSPEEESKD